MTKTLTRVFNDYSTANAAVQDLKTAGLSDSHIAIVASNADGWHKPGSSEVDPKHDKDRDGKDDRTEGAAAGGGIGAIAGGAAGVAAGLGMLAIPGIGPVVAMGWLATLAAGAIAGGAGGGIIGALVQSGTSKENAELYAEALRRGGSIVTAKVPTDEEAKYAAILDRSAVDMTQRASTYRAEGWKGYDPSAPAYGPDQARREREVTRT
ncbi:hypothetical protein FHS83_000129 [Rhizomicrobium palustre]|uniref:Heat induced stress protein YflT n=1 Tax=Rhizomicrobium palustre TaxID=189966 RepID=A0A846MUD4_9PROT|nr:hypothetical protein [Rhizomicrobium palustre]NIK86811.1 hypothetical protein [Rhizomicrobium palustre]